MIRRINAYSVFILVAVCTLLGATTTADSDYQQGVKALSSRDYPTAVHYFELAVSGDPDNVCFASEYRR